MPPNISSRNADATPPAPCIVYLHPDLTKPATMSVLHQSVELKCEFQTRSFPLNSTLKFNLIRPDTVVEITPEGKKVILGKPKGIRFEIGSHKNCFFDVFSSDQKVLLGWRDYLACFLNQRDFHNLYRPFRKLGKGNSATVYLGQRFEDGMRMAVKAFSKESLALQPRGREALENQIRLLRSLDHPHILRLYQVFETDNSIYLCLEYLKGGRLIDIHTTYNYTLDQIREIVHQLLEALVYLEEKKIIHRDLKPDNIVFRDLTVPTDFVQTSALQNPENLSSPQPPCHIDLVIADFGLATFQSEQNYIFVRCGTPGYVAPQILKCEQSSGQRSISDIFSLGVIIHTLVFKRGLFEGKNVREILVNNRKCEIDLSSPMYENMDRDLWDLMTRMLEVDVSKRIKPKEALAHNFFVNQNKFSKLLPDMQADEPSFISQVIATTEKPVHNNIKDSLGSFTIPRGAYGKDHVISPASISPLSPLPESPSSKEESVLVKKPKEHASRFSQLEKQQAYFSKFCEESESQKDVKQTSKKRVTSKSPVTTTEKQIGKKKQLKEKRITIDDFKKGS